MKINEVIVKEWTGPGKEFAPPTPKDFLPKKKQKLVMAQDEDEGLTSGADIVLSKNGEQAVRDLKLSNQEVEVLKAVALGWADPSDLGDLEQDIFDYWLDNNPEDFNPDLHGGGADPSDTILDELESWFEDTVPENNKGESVMKIEDILRMRKLAGLNEAWSMDRSSSKRYDALGYPIKDAGDDEWSGANVKPEDKRPDVEMQFITDPETGEREVQPADPDELRNLWWSHEDQKAAAQTAGASAAGMDLKRRREDMRQAWLHNNIKLVTHPKDRAKLAKLLARGGGRAGKKGTLDPGDGWSQMSGPPRIAGEEPDLFKYAQKKNAQKYYADQHAAMARAKKAGKNWDDLSKAEQEPYWEREINPRTGDPYPHWTPNKPDILKYAKKKNAEKRERDQKIARARAEKAGKNYDDLSKADQDAFRPKTPVDRAKEYENR